ncbi:divergent polysaccharide deacetylase family protein [Methylocystis echinoides]|uniref:divergent polysaccharide deacetylase family protein n=1 Tax=Methylocystis echinoides TaxID=29468 RepID=UPI00249196DE|nr:divergent polysaccharide deacetylase family protein [Methylocystis echinoides]
MTDELNAPLGRTRPPRTEPAAPRRYSARAVAGGAAALALALLYLAPRDPFGGEPHAVARIEAAKAPEPPAAPAAAQAPQSASQEPKADATAAQMFEEAAGVKVTRRGGEGGTARIIHVEPASGVRLPAAPDRRVTEKGPHGQLPKIGPDGARPMDVYARPFVTSTALAPGAPRLALIIGGLGLNAGSTMQAVDQLPDEVTLAFAPYGADVDRLAQQARARGHETLLQAPMEPFDYPHNNPGPHTLTTAAPDGGSDDLRWLMSRFTGYAGVMNHLGGRFSADESAMSGALGEIAQRGLFYVDDGASPQSRAGDVARAIGAPFAQVDVNLDEGGRTEPLEAALARLETLARGKGAAIGFANATPAAVARIARFARDLERRGIALAPVSATLATRGAGAAQGRK